MAPTPSATLGHSSNPPSARHLHLRRHVLGFAHHPQGQSSTSHTGQLSPRTPDPTLQPSLALEGPTPPSFTPTPSQPSDVLASQPSTTQVGNNQPQMPSQSGDIPGNIVVAIVVMVLILGGLIGLVIGGQVLRREAKTTGKVPPTPSGSVGRRKPKFTKDATARPQHNANMNSVGFPYDEKTLTPLTRPPPVLNRERRKKLSNVWPIRSLKRLCNRRSPGQDARGRQQPAAVASPATTWSEFSPVSLYAAPPRTLLPRIPEEHEEECQKDDFGVDVLHRLLEYNPVMASPLKTHPQSAHDTSNGSSVATECRTSEEKTKDEESFGSTTPDMTADSGESSRSSTISLESVKEEVFELRRVQTRSMQMNKGVLVSIKSGMEPRPASVNEEGVGELTLAMLGSFSVVDLDEFPSPPSTLPMIPSFVSGF